MVFNYRQAMENMMSARVILLVRIALLFWPTSIYANEKGYDGSCEANDCGGELPDLEDGLADLTDSSSEHRYEASPFSGFIMVDMAYGLHRPRAGYGFTRDEAEINKTQVEFNASYEEKLPKSWKLKISGNSFYNAYYTWKDRSRFPEETLDAYESEVELRDTFVEGPIKDHFWFKFGRQTIAWGEADFSQVLSLVNPVDIRELGRTDINDALVPVTASKLVFTLNHWEVDAVAIHEIRADKVPTMGSDLDFYAPLRMPGVTIEEPDRPSNKLENTEYLLRIFKPFTYGDVSIIYADVLHNQANLILDQFDSGTGAVTLRPEYDRYQALGLSANYVNGAWLFKTELAYKRDFAVSRRDLFEQLNLGAEFAQGTSEHAVQEAVIGFTYAGPDNLAVSVESFLRQIQGHNSFLAVDDNSWTHTLMINRDFMRERANGHLLFTHIPSDQGSSQIMRVGFKYSWSDSLVYNIGLILYQAERPNAYMYPYNHSDSTFFGIKYSF